LKEGETQMKNEKQAQPQKQPSFWEALLALFSKHKQPVETNPHLARDWQNAPLTAGQTAPVGEVPSM
jgi:hypothetical protein